MRSLILASLFLLPLKTWAVFPLSQCNVSVSPKDRPVLEQVYEKYLKQMSDWRATDNICAVDFKLSPATDQPQELCAITKFGVRSFLTPMLASMDFRNSVGTLYNVTYRVCQGDNVPETWIDDSIAEIHRVSVPAKFRKFDLIEEDSSNIDNEDDHCDVDRRVDKMLCTDDPSFKVFAWSAVNVTGQLPGSELIGVAPSPSNPSCVVVSYRLKGGGYRAKIGENKIDCISHARFKYRIDLLAVTQENQ